MLTCDIGFKRSIGRKTVKREPGALITSMIGQNKPNLKVLCFQQNFLQIKQILEFNFYTSASLMPKVNFRYTIGFTLIEVLVSIVILALGLLGLASLQGISLKNNRDAYLFSEANALAYEMSDRIVSNSEGWVSIPAPAASCNSGCNSAAASCTTTQLAAYDYCYWQQAALAKLAAGATAVVTKSPDGGTTCTGNSLSRCLTMTWSRTNQGLGSSMNTAKYQMEVTP